jgi:hypothetical protein
MKRSMIAVCLLLLSPSTVIACFEDHDAGVGWFEQQNLRWWSRGNTVGAMRSDRLMDAALVAGGLGVVMLVGVVVRAVIQAVRQTPVSPLESDVPMPLPVRFAARPCEPLRVWPDLDLDESGWPSSEIQEVQAESATWAASAIDSLCCVH